MKKPERETAPANFKPRCRLLFGFCHLLVTDRFSIFLFMVAVTIGWQFFAFLLSLVVFPTRRVGRYGGVIVVGFRTHNSPPVFGEQQPRMSDGSAAEMVDWRKYDRLFHFRIGSANICIAYKKISQAPQIVRARKLA
jgi:hypothetical protein